MVSFTVRFKDAHSHGWQWARDHNSTNDGHLLYQSESNPGRSLSTYFDGIDPAFDAHKERPETPDTLLWSVVIPAHAASGKDSGVTRHKLGIPKDTIRWFSLVRHWTPWLAPRHGKEKFCPDKDAILSAFLRSDGLHVVVLALSGVDDVLTTLNHDDDGNVVVQGRNDASENLQSRLLVALGKSFELANCAVMYHARKIISQYGTASGEEQAEIKTLVEKDVKAEWLESWYDGFSYCTWNGLGQNLTEDKIYGALDSLRRSDIHITNLIIDDNWQSLDNEGEGQMSRRWLEFEANKKGFPSGLKATTTKIRNEHKSIAHIAVWHALLGYWGGVSPEGKIAKDYGVTKVRSHHEVADGWMHVVDAENAGQMYNDFYRFLSNSGIDSVKTDAQFMIDGLEEADVRRRLIRRYQDVWTIASLRHFSAKAISCMSQAPQILFHSQMPTNRPRLLVRNSDDFFPGKKETKSSVSGLLTAARAEIHDSHPWHIFCNAHNSLLTQHLNVLPDWDMFQTDHPWAGFHAAARCLSEDRSISPTSRRNTTLAS